ncbi:glycosyltransferase family 4 protein [Actinoplanes sp. NPDC024001]|uniref:glycosyltransferase family 4 protein n=1 Tax=Actinoplanes sp. NPDC024001 TaxID=3154598 RepID=UPI0033D06A04
MQDQPEVLVRFGGRLDVTDWQRRHALGEVPDAWPYGLDRMAAHGIRVTPAPVYTGNEQLARLARAAGRFQWLEARTKAGKPDVVLCWDERVGVPAAWQSSMVLTGVIWLTDEHSGRIRRILGGSGLRRAHRVWSLSSAQLPVLRDVFGIPQQRLVHVPFGIDADFFTPGGEPTPGLVVSAGNDRHRDHSTLVTAAGRLKDPDVRLELATRHPVEVPSELGVRHSELTHPQMRDLYRRGAVTVVALRPNLHVSGISVTLEAMACARPVVVTDTPGMRDYVTHGGTGLLVPPGDVEALAAAVAELLADPQRAREMGAAARRDVERRFSTQVQAGHLAALAR